MDGYRSVFIDNKIVKPDGRTVPLANMVQDLNGRWRTPSAYELAVLRRDCAEIRADAAPKPARRRSLWDRLLDR